MSLGASGSGAAATSQPAPGATAAGGDSATWHGADSFAAPQPSRPAGQRRRRTIRQIYNESRGLAGPIGGAAHGTAAGGGRSGGGGFANPAAPWQQPTPRQQGGPMHGATPAWLDVRQADGGAAASPEDHDTGGHFELRDDDDASSAMGFRYDNSALQ